MVEDTGIYYMPPMKKGWRLTRIGYVCNKLSKSISEDSIALICSNKGKVVERPDDVTGKMVSEDHAMQGISKGDIAIHGMDTWHGAIAYSDLDGKITRVVHVCDSSEENRFIVYYLQLLAHIGVYKLISNGVRGNTSDFRSWDKVKDIRISLPSIDEQQAIADYLDKKTSEIDKAINEAQELIEKYKVYKQSVITEIVTQGLNPQVTMKDSGVEWIGNIPENWSVDKVKFHLQTHEYKGYPEATVLSLYRELGIVPKDSRDDNHNVTSEDTSKYKHVEVGNFVVNKMKAWQGSVAVSDYDGIVSPAYYVYKFSSNAFYKGYFHYLLRDKSYTPEFRRLSGGIREGQWDLSREGFRNLPVIIPPLKEQEAIAAYLDNKCSQIDTIIAQKENLISQLQEYKKSIIFEYVTGKKEVPNG